MFGTVLASAGNSTITVSDALSQIGNIVTECINWIQGNTVLMTCFVAGMIPVGFMVIRKAKKASKA